MIALYVILGLLICFAAVLLLRAAAFRPAPQKETTRVPEEFDREMPVERLAKLIRCKTVSDTDPAKEDDAEFEKLIALLPELYPAVYARCGEPMRLPDRGLLFRWPGAEPGEPAILMAHYDVVPVDEAGWTMPPFCGEIVDGVLWGRGALDTKVTFNGILSAAEHLIPTGFIPKHDVYFAFSGGEEVNGAGAEHIVAYFREQKIVPSLVVDEGGAVVEDVFPGVKAPCAMIGIAEKGQLNLEFKVKSAGGHASAPPPHTPVGVLSRACCRMEDHPFPAHITEPVAKMFDTLGRRSSFVYRIIFANLWCFGGLLGALSRRSGGEMNALLRSTVAFTMMQGSSVRNVLPPEATMTANIRLNPADSMESALEYVRKTIADSQVELTAVQGMEPSRISQSDGEAYRRVADAIEATWPGSITTPYLMVQCSDSRHYGVISDRVYRFSAMDLTKEERGLIHGNNERIRVETVGKAVEFYIRLMRTC